MVFGTLDCRLPRCQFLNKANVPSLPSLVSQVLIFKWRAADLDFGTHNTTTSSPHSSTFGLLKSTVPHKGQARPWCIIHLLFILRVSLKQNLPLPTASPDFLFLDLSLQHANMLLIFLPHKNEFFDLFSHQIPPLFFALLYRKTPQRVISVHSIDTPSPFSWTHSNPAFIHIILPILLL